MFHALWICMLHFSLWHQLPPSSFGALLFKLKRAISSPIYVLVVASSTWQLTQLLLIELVFSLWFNNQLFFFSTLVYPFFCEYLLLFFPSPLFIFVWLTMSSDSQDYSKSELYEYPLEEDDYQLVTSQLFTVNFTPASFFPLSISIDPSSVFTEWSIDEEINHMGEMSNPFVFFTA